MPENDNPEVEDTEEVDPLLEDQEPDDEEEAWEAPSKERWEKLENAARARKEEVRALRKQVGELKAQSKEEEPEESGESKWRAAAARNSAATALSAAGFPGSRKQAARLTRLLDLSDVEPDDNGDFDFDDEIETLKEEFPALFAEPGEQRRRAPRVTTSDRGRTAGGTSKDRTTERLMKQAGFR
ncbi:phage scaffolding protein [Streptomyces anulatus]|uniref:phage scaffolding protein n=1 Tax=Streptomyces anulatus TaxID=1892 RepID=UPI00225C041D|nr:hypothetical protein [Streptomyces anulatus]MCX4504572.1 hypothetical protein [Streptomyces anulatus]